MTKRTGLGLIAAIAAIAGLITMVSVVSAAVTDITMGSATVGTGANATVALNATAVADDGSTTCPSCGDAGDGIGAWQVDVTFDTANLTFVSCTAHASGLCSNPVAGTVRFTGANANGVVGSPVELGTVTLTAGTTVGTYPLDATIVTLTDPPGTDIVLTAVDGSITVQAPTATPSPTPTPSPTSVATATPTPTLAPATATPTRTPTPAALPPTGGVSSDGSGDGLAWALGALGLAVLAGGVWAVSRTRRHTA
ncbi:MAG TPA: hypothetical protein VFO59_09315 [Dehalococcoidia bacterium]|nr:hypothetical protein [Dehalococcoidia bacterium]